MLEGGRGGGVRVCMTNNFEGCIKKHDGGGGGGVKKMPQISMTSFMDGPLQIPSCSGAAEKGGGGRFTCQCLHTLHRKCIKFAPQNGRSSDPPPPYPRSTYGPA